MKLILFGTSACHLCEQAHSLLQETLSHYPQVDLETIDIAEQNQWQEKYAIRIPVLFHPQSQRELGWFFDQTTVLAFINELENDE
jgi:glutaredoxin